MNWHGYVCFLVLAFVPLFASCGESGGSSAETQAPDGGTVTSAGGSGTGGSSAGAGGAPASGGASTGGSSGSTGGSASLVFQDSWTTCSTDADCVVVPFDSCCGCEPRGVNQDFEDEARAVAASFVPSECPPLGCAAPPCPPDPVPICEQGRCSWEPGCSEHPLDTCAADPACEPYEARRCNTTDGFSVVTCGKLKNGCNEIETCALSPDAVPFLFPDSCVPEGWSPCPVACN